MPTVQLFVLVAALWLLWSGHYTPLILTLGLGSVSLVVFLCRRMGILDREIAPFHTAGSAVRYLPWLALEVVKSSLGVIRRVLDPALPIEPQTVRVIASQRTGLGRVTYANSITLTPGTLTIDAVDDHLTVHALSDEGAADLASGRMDRKITLLEPADPLIGEQEPDEE
ncbi:MAG: Na+/H+ antiporter subunit E [Thermoanaerobaculia bacterium]